MLCDVVNPASMGQLASGACLGLFRLQTKSRCRLGGIYTAKLKTLKQGDPHAS